MKFTSGKKKEFEAQGKNHKNHLIGVSSFVSFCANLIAITQQIFDYLKTTIETLEKDVKYVQSWQ